MNLVARTGRNLADAVAAHFPLPQESLALTQVAVTLSIELGLEVPLRLLFEAPSAAALTDSLSRLVELTPLPPSRSRPLPERSRRRRRRLSFSQERMCFMRALSGPSTAYHVTVALRLRGALDRSALARTVSKIPEMFPVLRTRYVPGSEGIEPVVENHSELVMSAHHGVDFQAWVDQICGSLFDLEKGVTARAALLQIEPQHHVLLLVFDHSVIDLHAVELLLEALADHYTHYTQLVGSVLDVPARRYASYRRYAEWHRRWFREYRFVDSRNYWLQRLHLAERVSLETDFPRPVVASFRGRRFGLPLPEERWQALERLAKVESSSLAVLLFATLAIAVANRTGTEDLVIGVPIANRHHEDAADCFGPLLNTLAMRIAIGYQQSFREFLSIARQQFLDALEHQDMPFEVLVDQLRLPRLPGLSPLFGIMLNMLNTAPAAIQMPGLSAERIEVDRGGAQFDLTLTVDRIHTRTVWFEYATDLYRPDTIADFAELFDCILAQIQTDADIRLADLPHRLRKEVTAIAGWSVGPPAQPEVADVFGRFCGVAGRMPGKIAVVCGPQVLTYGEALARATRLAAALRKAAAGTNGRVGVLLERSVALPVVVLASLCAGITFVPLDPAFPDQRLAHMAQDSQLGLFIVDQAEFSREPWMPADAIVLSLDAFDQDAPGATLERADVDRPAYVLYTSGSSGQPKGVEIGTDALACFLAAMLDAPGITESDRLLAVTTLNFDISLLELLLPLMVGATVVVASRAEARDPQRLSELLNSQSITLLQCTPSLWAQLIESQWEGRTGVRALVGGEALNPDLAAQLLPRVGELWNLYGPTEATIWSTCAQITDARLVTAGRPIRGTTVEIVDSLNRPTGIATTGEIVIGGRGLANGYLNLPEQSETRFPRLPGVNGGQRIYRTGDLGRWTRDGQIQVLGRADRQIKLRGHRIELQEIEIAAQTVPGVTRAVAAVQKRSSTDMRLALFYGHQPSCDPGEADVTARLRSLLPDYMVPQLLRAVGQFPVLPNGKTDVNALLSLPEEEGARPTGRRPMSMDELTMAAIWRELLDLSDVDCDQDFFHLGGHSLIAMRLVSRVRDEMRRECTLALVFANSTIGALCTALAGTPALTSEAMVPLQSEGSGTPLYCICGIQIYRRLVTELDLDAPVYAVYLPAHADNSITDLARRYLDAIRAARPHGPYQLLGFSLGGVLAHEIAQQLLVAGEPVERLVIMDSDVPGQTKLDRLRFWLRRFSSSGAMPEYLRLIREHEARPYAGEAIYVEAARGDHFHPGHQWSDLIPALQTIRLDCDHMDLLTAPHVTELAVQLSPAMQPKPGS